MKQVSCLSGFRQILSVCKYYSWGSFWLVGNLEIFFEGSWFTTFYTMCIMDSVKRSYLGNCINTFGNQVYCITSYCTLPYCPHASHYQLPPFFRNENMSQLFRSNSKYSVFISLPSYWTDVAMLIGPWIYFHFFNEAWFKLRLLSTITSV